MIPLLSLFAKSCPQPSFFSFPTWYTYLPMDPNTCTPELHSINDIWLIVAAVIEILLRVAALAAIGMVIYGGISFATSQGSPESTNQARSTIINALIGLIISIIAGVTVAFIARSF